MNEHQMALYTQRQIAGLIAERDALVLALAAKQEQVDGLVQERDELRAVPILGELDSTRRIPQP